MRLAWYAGTSTALAAAVIVSAFHQRANFYSAMVYLSQSNLCLMILVNLVFLIYGSCMYGLQRVCFGQLRPVEIEQLYEKAWFAVTETCLAMTIFREEVGAFFLVMFTSLVTGKVWGWIGEGRVEVLEQQPPANPRLFHTRLSISLVLSLLYDMWLLRYSVRTVIQQARPDMMVMFLFEFAILTVCSIHTGVRYIVSLVEASIVKKQTHQRLEDRRRQIRQQRADMIRQREEAGGSDGDGDEALPDEEDVDEMDIEVPGWEAKGQWVLTLDLCADFLKLCIYTTFFGVLLTFYGLPIHIMRDLFMTARSFVKRLGALMRYRQAVRDMNKYPDATEEDLSRENTCIICREEMHLWDPHDAGQVERSRPKKLPCGHILHFGCLKSWLERQQVCPTCRRSVVMTDGPAARNRDAVMFRLNLNLGRDQDGAAANAAAPGGQGGADNNGGQPPGNGANGGNGVRMFNFGPLRLGFAQGGAGELQEMAQRLGMDVGNLGVPAAANNNNNNNNNNPPSTAPAPASVATSSAESISTQLREIEQRIQRESAALRFAEQEATTIRLLLTELQRIRQMAALAGSSTGAVPPPIGLPTPPMFPVQPGSQFVQQHNLNPYMPRINSPSVMRLGADPNTAAIPAGSPDLPDGVTLPPGWSLLPLQPLDGSTAAMASGAAASVSQPQIPPEIRAALQQTLQASITPSQPPATSSQPLGGTGPASGPTSHPARGQGQASHDSQQDDSGSSSSPVLSRSRAAEPVHVAQPTPVMPNWGGSAQLFGRDNNNVFGLNVPTPGRATPVQPGEAAGASGGDQQGDEAPPPQVSGPDESNSSDSADHEGQNGSTSRGKARAATVEEADESEN